MEWETLSGNGLLLGILLLVCGLLMHSLAFSRVARWAWLARVQDSARYPTLGFCFCLPLWWWSRHAQGPLLLRYLLFGSIFFFLGATAFEIWLGIVEKRLEVRGRRIGYALRGVGYSFLFVASVALTLSLRKDPSAVLVPLLYTGILYWSLNLTRLALLRLAKEGAAPWDDVRKALSPWFYPLIALISTYYLLTEWNYVPHGVGLRFHARLLLQVLLVGAVGEALIVLGFHYRAPENWKEGSWYRDMCRSALYIGLAWNYYTWVSGRSLADVLVGSAFLSVGLGFALRPTVGNFAAGLVLQMTPPFAIGDFLLLGTHLGWVHSIDWRSTSLITRSQDLVVLPNASVAHRMLINYSAPSKRHACFAEILFDGLTEPRKIRQAIKAAMDGYEGVLQEPAHEVFLLNFARGGLLYRVQYWITDISLSIGIESDVHLHLAYCLKRAGLEPLVPVRRALI